MINVDRGRDSLLTSFGKTTLRDRYLLPREDYQDIFVRVAQAYSDNEAHAQRLYDAMSRLWFMPSTPILSNGGTDRGLPISCFLNQVSDSLEGIVQNWVENVWLASGGGGLGIYYGKVRSIGEKVGNRGETSGIIPFIHVDDALTLAISQGSLRRGSAAIYVDIDHPEIFEILEMRKASGDFNRKALNLHHGINITDEFMQAVQDDTKFALRSPKTKEVISSINARELWQRILETRLQTGEPYLLFIDTVNRALPSHLAELGLKVSSSNLCSETCLPVTDERTAVCCLLSLNLETYNEWVGETGFIEDLLRMLDNVLEDFIKRAPKTMQRAVYSAMRERSVGIGVMGWHSLLQQWNVPFESAVAKSLNMNIFKKIRKNADDASLKLGTERGPCDDAFQVGSQERFSHKLAIAPTASISIICGGTSACIEPIPANVYTHKTLSGSTIFRNKYLEKVLEEKNYNREDIWQSIVEHEGSVQHLNIMTDDEKDIFKTAFEIDQRWIIDLAADRAPYICQSQSVNLFLPSNIDKWDLHMLHWTAWKKGLKSLYYCRSKSLSRAGEYQAPIHMQSNQTNYAECLSCQ